MSQYSEGETHRLMDQLEAAGLSSAEVTKLGERSFLDDFLLVLRGRARVLLATIYTTIHVDRKRKPTAYPKAMTRLLHPDLELDGPRQFDVVGLRSFYLPIDDPELKGIAIYEALKTWMFLSRCLSLRDLEEIQAKDLPFFRRFYGGKMVLGWKSVAEFETGRFRVPYLYENVGKVSLGWRLLEHTFPSEKYLTRYFDLAA